MSDPEVVHLRAYFERLLDERDRQSGSALKGLREVLEAKLKALEDRLLTMFSSAQMAIEKSEAAQRDYNARSNEFRGQLDDQAKHLMPREETVTMFKSMTEKVDQLKDQIEQKVSRSVLDAYVSSITDQITTLREFRGSYAGGKQAAGEAQNRSQWVWAFAVSVVLSMLSVVLSVIGALKGR